MILDIAKQHIFLNRLGAFMGWIPWYLHMVRKLYDLIGAEK